MSTFDSRIPPVPAVRADGSPDVVERRHSAIGTLSIDGTPSAVVPAEPTRAMWAGAGTAVIATRARTGNHDDMSGAVHAAMLAAADPSLTEAVLEMRAALHELLEANYVESHGKDWDRPLNEVWDRCEAALARITIQETSDG